MGDVGDAVADQGTMPSPAFGVTAALASPALAVLGLFLWDEYWSGSPFALNLYKCTLATFFYLGGLFASESLGLNDLSFLDERAAMLALCATSLFGIVVGDNMWLTSMMILGPRKLILLDSLKPFLASAMAGTLLHESTPPLALLAMLVSVTGVAVVSLDRQNATREPSGRGPACALLMGYSFAVLNMVFDVIGSVVMKEYASHFGPWAIGVFRYGFASITMIGVYGVCTLRAAQHLSSCPRGRKRAARGAGAALEMDDELEPLATEDERISAASPERALVGRTSDPTEPPSVDVLSSAEAALLRAARSTQEAHALAQHAGGDDGADAAAVVAAAAEEDDEEEEEEEGSEHAALVERAQPHAPTRAHGATRPVNVPHVPTIGRTRSELGGGAEAEAEQPLLEHGGAGARRKATAKANARDAVSDETGSAALLEGDADADGFGGADVEAGSSKVVAATSGALSPGSGGSARTLSRRRGSAEANEEAWYRMPEQPARSWLLVSLGVVFVTFLSMALTNVSLFAIPLGLNLTLQSLGPVYAIPLACALEGERVSARTLLASLFAVAGAAAFCHLTLQEP